jgi:hypothetical protein
MIGCEGNLTNYKSKFVGDMKALKVTKINTFSINNQDYSSTKLM